MKGLKLFYIGLFILFVSDIIDNHFIRQYRTIIAEPVVKSVLVDEKNKMEYKCRESGFKSDRFNYTTCYSYYILYDNRSKRLDVPFIDYLNITPGGQYEYITGYENKYHKYFEFAKIYLYMQMLLFVVLIFSILYLLFNLKENDE